MTQGNGTAELAPYIECVECYGRGLVRARVDTESRLTSKDPEQVIAWREHDRCSGAGILILRTPKRGEPYYGLPKLT